MEKNQQNILQIFSSQELIEVSFYFHLNLMTVFL